MKIPQDREYTSTHEWLQLQGATATLGVTDRHPFAKALLTRLEIGKPGNGLKAGDVLAIATDGIQLFEIRTPICGAVVEINPELLADPSLLQRDPFGQGWIAQLKVEAGEELEHLEEPSEYAEQAEPEAAEFVQAGI